ncbi:MAG: AI-2E family transporter [Immundisolibacter sp.]
MRSSHQTGWALLTLVLVITALNYGQGVLMPLALATLFAFLLAPLVKHLQGWGCNRPVAVALVTAVTLALVGTLGYIIVNQFLGLAEDLPSYQNNLLAKIRGLSGLASDGLGRGAETVKALSDELQKSDPGQSAAPRIAKVQIVQPSLNALQVFRGVFGPLITPAATAATVVVFVIFILLQREDIRDRLVRLFGTKDMHTTLLALDEAAERVSRYLMMQTLINGLQGLAVAVALYLIGVPDAMLWGALTVVLRFIPYLGPVVAAIGPIAVSLAFFDNWTAPSLTIGVILTLELISNNVIEPRLYGSSVGISALALIAAAVFWTWLWGLAGLFLATPMTVCLVVMGKYIPQLEFLSVVLSDRPVLEPHERFYQRLLATDVIEAEDLLDQAKATHTLAEACDLLILPALRLVEQDHDRGAIDQLKRQSMLDLLDSLIEEFFEPGQPNDEPPHTPLLNASGLPLKVLCLPAANTADELAARVFAALLEHKGIAVHLASITTLKSEMLDLVDDVQPDLICISGVPPAAVIHARYLCKKLRGRFAQIPLVAGLWSAQGDPQGSRERLTSAGATKMVGTVTAGLEETARLLHPLVRTEA